MSGSRLEHPWFRIEPEAAGIWRIAEPGHVSSWLVNGGERSLLVDTGLGIAPIRPVAEALATAPIAVVNTHHHFDHVGGNREFPHVAIHRAGVDALAGRFDPDQAAFYMARVGRRIAERPPGSELRSLPPGFDPRRWEVPAFPAAEAIDEDDLLDLGDSVWRVIHLPGHSADEIGLLNEREGVLIAGDAVDEEDNYAQFLDSDLRELRATVDRLLDLASSVDVLLLSHSARAVRDWSWVADVGELVDEALAGATGTPAGEDLVGNPIHELRRGARTLVVPPPGVTLPPLTLLPGPRPPRH